MSITIIYSLDKSRIIPAVLIDNRATNGLAGKTGFEIKEVTDAAVEEVGVSDIFYILETDLGNLAGYFVLRVNISNFTVNLTNVELRPAFKSQNDEIQQQIALFINQGIWKTDILI